MRAVGQSSFLSSGGGGRGALDIWVTFSFLQARLVACVPVEGDAVS